MMCNSIPSLSNSNPLKGSGSGMPGSVGNSGSRSVGGNSSGVTGAEVVVRATSKGIVSAQSVRTVALGETKELRDVESKNKEPRFTVASKLTKNLAKTASNFLGTGIQGIITSQFKEQIKLLEMVVNRLKESVDKADATKMLAINAAITEINGFVSRFNNNGVGGIDKAMFNGSALESSLQKVAKNRAEEIQYCEGNC